MLKVSATRGLLSNGAKVANNASTNSAYVCQRPYGATPLYDTISKGVAALQEAAADDAEDTVNALVILTDSNDNPPTDGKDHVRARQIQEILTNVAEEVEVFTAAAFDTPCSEFRQDVPAFDTKHCFTVEGIKWRKGVNATLRKILGRLEEARR